MDSLKRKLAPITPAAWEEIESVCKETLSANLTGRKVVDVDGPHGFDYAAVPEGRLRIPEGQAHDRIGYGIHTVKPMVEVRVPFRLNIWEMDNADRGALDIDVDPVIHASKEAAKFEDNAIYKGLGEAQITGLEQTAGHSPIQMSGADDVLPAVAQAITAMRESSISGPYNLVAGEKIWKWIVTTGAEYPLINRLERLLNGGSVIYAPSVDAAFLASDRGGDFTLTTGRDFSIGYEAHDTTEVRLYLSWSFTFRILEQAALVNFKL